VACRARRVLEAQYQDAVRIQIDNLYTAFVDVLAARETLRFARASVEGLERLASVTRELKPGGGRTQPEIQQVEIQRESARLALEEAEAGVRRASRTLGALLQLPPGSTAALDVSGTLRPVPVGLPPLEELGRMALSSRPDLAAYRLGVDRAAADLRLARANRFSDVFLMVQPYTFQDNSPYSAGSAHSWAVGMTVPVPVFNRNQGNIERARLNVDQTRTEMATLQQAVLTEVEQAEEEFRLARDAAARLESEIVPAAARMLADTDTIYRQGETDLIAYLIVQRNYNDVVRQYRDALVRQRRAALRLNTVVGCRLLP
jgi:cobalt-zinc-cadmium efflux system outer membrane protein